MHVLHCHCGTRWLFLMMLKLEVRLKK
jgi:hypothetical protein